MKRAVSYGLISVAVVLCLASIYVWKAKPETPVEAGARTLNAFETRDGQAVWNRIPPEEKKLYPELNESRIQALLDLSGFGTSIAPRGEITAQENPRDGSASVGQDLIFSGRFHESFALRAEVREGHVAQVCRPITSLIFLALYNSGLQSDPKYNPTTSSRAPIYMQGLKKLKDKLTSIGIKGAADVDLTAVVPWDTWQAQWNEKMKQ